MSENSKIEWCDHTFNPWIGCTKVSPGCANCYACDQDKHRRWTPHGWGKGKPRRRTSATTWRLPIKWNQRHDNVLFDHAQLCAQDIAAGQHVPAPERPRVFCASLADWLDDEVPIDWLGALLTLIFSTPTLDWLLLTKRPENFHRLEEAKFASDYQCSVGSWLDGNPPANVWLGTSVEDQQRADERIPRLLSIPARVRFLSCEPLLGPVDLSAFIGRAPNITGDRIDPYNAGLDWVIAGGESGRKARPMDPACARLLRDQCRSAGVPFLFKQWGTWLPAGQVDAHGRPQSSGETYLRMPKATAGRSLDGEIHDAYPIPRP